MQNHQDLKARIGISNSAVSSSVVVSGILRRHSPILKLDKLSYQSPLILSVQIAGKGNVLMEFPHNPGNSSGPKACALWNGRDFIVDSGICQTALSNSSHTQCVCTRGGDFSLVMVSQSRLNEESPREVLNKLDDINQEDTISRNFEDEETTAIIIIVAISSSAVIVTLLLVALVIVYCKRVKVSRLSSREKKIEQIATH